MSALAIAVRELRERARLFLICAALALVPFIAAVLPGGRVDRTAVIAAVSSFLALALALGSAIALGASTVARDLVERRLSFYFAKPVSPASIWIGKAAASVLASFVCFAIIALPSVVATRGEWPLLWMMTAGQLVFIVAAGVIVLFLVSHVLASMIRSRSGLIAVDFVLVVLFAGAVVLLARTLLIGAAFDLVRVLGIVLGVVVLVVAALAPIGQLARGRTDIRRSHAALSRFLWPPLFALVAVAAVYVWWVGRVTPDDVAAVFYVEQAPAGERAVISGSARSRGDYQAAFVVEPSGRWRRLPAAAWSQAAFSRDGRTMVWSEPATFFPSSEVMLRSDRGAAEILTVMYSEVVVSDDGSRVAVGQGRLISVYDLGTGKLLASAGGFDGGKQHTMFFVSNDVLRIIESDHRRAGPLRILELDVAHKKLLVTGTSSVPTGDSVIASSDGARLLLRRTRRVVDARTAATLLQLPAAEITADAVLRDGRVVEIHDSVLRVIGGREIRLPASIADVAGELDDHTLLLSAAQQRGWSATGAGRMMLIVDVDRGVVVREVKDVKGPHSRWWATDPRLQRYTAPRLVGVDARGRIIWWSPNDGLLRTTDLSLAQRPVHQ